jgi:hypothetical protein
MGLDYVEIQLDRPRRMKFKMRTIGEAEQFLPQKFVHYFLSPEARRALGASAASGLDLTEEDLLRLDALAEGRSDSDMIAAIGQEKYERLTQAGLGPFEFYGHQEILILFWASLLHEDPKLTQSQTEGLIEEHVEARGEFQKFARVLRWVVEAAMLYFGGGLEKKAKVESSGRKSGSTGTGDGSGA